VLFLDEAPEFSRQALEALRQPLEDGRVHLTRTGGGTEYPAQVLLVLAANPCPCAKPAGDARCECTAQARRRYQGRLSGPLLDRVDIQVTLLPLRAADLLGAGGDGEPSAQVAERVAKARAAAGARWAHQGWRTNADVPGAALRRPPWRLPRSQTAQLRSGLDRGTLSARGFERILRLAWSIADLDGRDRPDRDDVAEAAALRTGEAL
jgi:magnesium chelatase family protein